MTSQPKPTSAAEACAREIGVAVVPLGTDAEYRTAYLASVVSAIIPILHRYFHQPSAPTPEGLREVVAKALLFRDEATLQSNGSKNVKDDFARILAAIGPFVGEGTMETQRAFVAEQRADDAHTENESLRAQLATALRQNEQQHAEWQKCENMLVSAIVERDAALRDAEHWKQLLGRLQPLSATGRAALTDWQSQNANLIATNEDLRSQLTTAQAAFQANAEDKARLQSEITDWIKWHGELKEKYQGAIEALKQRPQ